MKPRYKNVMTVFGAAVLAIGLAACGGGGGGSTMMEPMEPTAEERAEMQRTAINGAIMTARTTVAGLTDDASDAAIGSADSAVTAAKSAVSDAADIDADEKAAFNVAIAAIEDSLTQKKSSIMTAREEAADEMKAAMAKTGKALHAALGPPATDTTPATYALANIAAPTLSADGLAVDAAAGAGALPDATDPASVTLKAGDSARPLGGWMGTMYAHTNSETKVMNEAVVYNNKGSGETVSLADAGINVHTAESAGDDIKGYYTVDEAADVGKIMGSAFLHSGTQTHSIPDRSDAFYRRGTFDGAPGEYRCTGACSSTNDGKGSPSALGGVWHFKPDAGAMVHRPDTHYLYYGWWVSKDKDGMPTAASAFAGRVGTDPGNSTDGLDNAWTGGFTAGTTLTGSATYAGHAAGRFAMNNPLDGTGNGGHFTADAMLEATFGATGTGITGTIDNFMLNDSESVDWSVSLHRAAFGDDGTFATPATDNADTAANETLGTTWTVDGNAAARSGTWKGNMYDEAVTGDDDDGSNLPTTATGTFYSEFSTNGRMAGAFGADKE